ncbi:MAG: apolipoprotein N-acyltransferase [Bacteroidota bacterium]
MSNKVRWSGFGISLLVAGWLAYDLFRLYQSDLLWGHRTLVFWSAAWMAVLFLAYPKFSPLSKNLKYLGAAQLSGLLLSLAWPPLPFFPLLFVGFVPLLWVEDQVAKSQTAGSTWIVTKYAFSAFLTWNILSTFWVTNTLFLAGVMAIIPNSVLMTIPFVLYHMTKKRVGLRLAYAGLVCYWICLETGHLYWKDISWPWLILGNGFARFPWTVQWYELTGVFGGTLWVWFTNILVFDKWRTAGKWSFKLTIVPLMVVLIPLAGSIVRYLTYVEKGYTKEVVVVQPNYEPHYEKFSIPAPVQMEKFLGLSRSMLTDSTAYLVFPESSFSRVWHNDISDNKQIFQLRDFLSDYPDLHLVTGLNSYRRFEDGDPEPMAPRTYNSGTETVTYESYNSAVQITSGSPEIDIYLKSKLVPGAEFPPFAAGTKLFKPLVDALGGSMAGLGTQKERSVFWSKDEKTAVAPVICYESVFGEYVTRYVKNGAGLLFIITNDGWWGNTAGHRQHLLYARLRAIETRRSIARSANTGTSAFLDQKGNIHQPTDYEVDAAIRQRLKVNEQDTFYIRYGDLISRLALFTAVMIFLVAFVQGRLKKGKEALPASSKQ